MRHFIACLALTLAAPAIAQDAVFDDYAAMRAELDSLVSEKRTQDLMLRFGGADEMTEAQLDNLDAQVEQLYPQPFTRNAVLRHVTHENGFHQEVIAYWNGLAYLFVYVFYHEVDGRLVSINMRFNSDFTQLNTLF